MADDDADLLGDEKGPERTCIVTRQKDAPERLLRFVLGPDGTVVPDIRAKLPGRGAWVIAAAETVEQAIRRKAFARAFRREVAVPQDLLQQVDGLLAQDALQALAFANKAGHVICGAMKVESALAKGTLTSLIHAGDGSADGIRKIEAAARRSGRGGAELDRIQIFSSSQLDLALGRSNVVHAGLVSGGVSSAFVARASRLERFRGASPDRAEQGLDAMASGEM